jgi:hypothetical protein
LPISGHPKLRHIADALSVDLPTAPHCRSGRRAWP